LQAYDTCKRAEEGGKDIWRQAIEDIYGPLESDPTKIYDPVYNPGGFT